jgi:hypothetical protein
MTPAPKLEQADDLFVPADALEVEDFEKRLRYRGKLDPVQASEPVLAYNWGLYRRFLRRTGRTRLINEFNLDDAFRAKNWKEYLGWVSDKAKKEQRRFSLSWRYLVDMTTFGGYQIADESDFIQDVRDWVSKHHPHTVDGSEDTFLSMFEDEMRDWVNNAIKPTTVSLTIEDYANDPSIWARAGSSFDLLGHRLMVETNGHAYKAKKTKWNTALKDAPEVTVRRIRTYSRQAAKAAVKRELKKARAIVSSDLDTYLKQDYVSRAWLDAALRGNPDSTLFMTTEQLTDMWKRFMSPGIAMPLDQSQFDHEVNLPMIMIVLQQLQRRARETLFGSARDDVLSTLERIMYAFQGGFVDVFGIRIAIKNGILSGWKWTALLDTIINIIEMRVARRLVMREWGQQHDPVDWFNAQGDDDLIRSKRVSYCVALYLAYVHMQFKINPAKFFISTSSDEYLRRVADLEQRAMLGYPARSVNSITNRNPISEHDRPGFERMNDTLTRWNTFASRLGLDSVPPEAIDDIAKSSEMSNEEVLLWLRTPLQLGGGGINVLPGLGLGVTSNVRTMPTLKLLNARGLDKIISNAKHFGMDVDIHNTQKWLQSVVSLQPKVYARLAEWQEPETFPVVFTPVKFETIGTYTPPRQPEAWTRAFTIAPTNRNAKTAPIKPNVGVPLWWWIDRTTVSGPTASFRVFGRNWEWLGQYAMLKQGLLDRWFFTRRAGDKDLWNLANATMASALAESDVWKEYDVRV